MRQRPDYAKAVRIKDRRRREAGWGKPEDTSQQTECVSISIFLLSVEKTFSDENPETHNQLVQTPSTKQLILSHHPSLPKQRGNVGDRAESAHSLPAFRARLKT